jgi:hypothetical protein
MILLFLLFDSLAGTALIPGVVLLLFVSRLEPDSDGGRITESVGFDRERPGQS